MVARLRVVRAPKSDESATADLFSDTGTGHAADPQPVGNITARIREDAAPKPARPMDDESQLLDIDQLYPASDEINTRLSGALGLMVQASLRIERAMDALRAGDMITADDQVSHLLVGLQELFSFRDLGEGFANVVSASIAAIQNTNGNPLSERQLVGLNTAVRSLRKKPFLTFDNSMEIAERLESVGLNVEAEGLDAVQDWLIGSGVR